MAATVEKIAQDALRLSERERAELAHKLLVSLKDSTDENVDKAWDAEIQERVARINEGTANGRLAEDVFRDIRARYK